MEDDILITPTNESIEDITKNEEVVEFSDMNNFVQNNDSVNETIVVKDKGFEEETEEKEINIESVKKKKIDYYFITNICIFIAISIVLLTGILNANNIRVRVAKKYCEYLKSLDFLFNFTLCLFILFFNFVNSFSCEEIFLSKLFRSNSFNYLSD